jgi:hypothetical protein
VANGLWVVAAVPARLWTALEIALSLWIWQWFGKKMPAACKWLYSAKSMLLSTKPKNYYVYVYTGLPVAKNATGKPLASHWLATGRNCQNLQKR